MKNTIFTLLLTISFQGILYAPWGSNNLSKKAQDVGNFLSSQGYDETDQDACNAVAHFNSKNESGMPDSGIPIYIHKTNNIFQKCSQTLEKTLLGYSWQDCKTIFNSQKAKQNNNYLPGPNPYSDNRTSNNRATTIASMLRQHININENIDIPIIENKFRYINSFDQNWASKGRISVIGDKLCYHIVTNPELNKNYPNTIPFQIARELIRLERGNNYIPLRNLLMTKAALGITGLALSYIALRNGSPSWLNPLACGMGALTGILLGNSFKERIEKQEEQTCNIRAQEICKKAGYDLNGKGAKEFLSLRAKLNPHIIFSDNQWNIRELNITKHHHDREEL